MYTVPDVLLEEKQNQDLYHPARVNRDNYIINGGDGIDERTSAFPADAM